MRHKTLGIVTLLPLQGALLPAPDIPRVLPWARRRLPIQGALINAVESLQGALDSVQVANYKEALKSYQVIF